MQKKVIGLIGAALLLITVGLFVIWYRQPAPARQQLLEVAKQSAHVHAQYRNADYQTAKAALLDHRRLLDQMNETSQSPKLNPYAVDAILISVRLAKLEEKNAGTAATQFMQEAMTRCAKAGWGNCSEAKLRLTVDQMDGVTATR